MAAATVTNRGRILMPQMLPKFTAQMEHTMGGSAPTSMIPIRRPTLMDAMAANIPAKASTIHTELAIHTLEPSITLHHSDESHQHSTAEPAI